MKKLFILISIPLLTSCSATMETRLSKSTPNAPVNEINGGIVSYLNQGGTSVIRARRNNAYKKMHDSCNGDYKILEEGERIGAGIATPIGNSVIYDNERHWNIRFECMQG